MTTPAPSPGDLVTYHKFGSSTLQFGVYLRDLLGSEVAALGLPSAAGFVWLPQPGGLAPQVASATGVYTGVDTVLLVNITGLCNANHTDEFFITNLLS